MAAPPGPGPRVAFALSGPGAADPEAGDVGPEAGDVGPEAGDVGPEAGDVGPEAPEAPGRRQGKVTVRYDRRELRKRLHLEEWILQQLTALFDCPEEEIPELEIDVDELLELESDGARSARIQEILVDCYKPTEAFIVGLLEKIRGLQKLNPPQKK